MGWITVDKDYFPSRSKRRLGAIHAGGVIVYWCNVDVCPARFLRSQVQASRGKSATSTWIGTFQEAILTRGGGKGKGMGDREDLVSSSGLTGDQD